jgi:DNA-binding transcriptional MocR family regulator
MRPVGAAGTPAARHVAATLLARSGWQPDPAQVLFAGNGRQAIAAAIAALVPAGARLGVEELTYPVLKAIAGRLGVTLVPLAMDEAGLLPQAVAAAHRKAPLRAVYIQPTLHNPLSLTMPMERRVELAGTLERLGIYAIEDTIWAFLRDDLPPLAALAPEHTILIDSLSKRLAPGLTVGFAVTPGPVLATVAAALRSGGWAPMRFALEAATRWLTDGAVDSVVRAKQSDAALRQEIASRHLGDFTLRSAPCSYYCWWELPRPWRADTFVAAAARHGIAVTPAAAFAVGRYRAPNAIRLGLASPPVDVLSHALTTLAGLAHSMPDDLATD